MNNYLEELKDLTLDEIESIELTGDEETIDITVEDTHMFFANEIYTHNSGFNTEHADEQNIGKAIEVYQVCDWMLLFTQSLPMQELNECYVQLLKNRLGPKGLTLKLHYDPSKVIFEELETVSRALLLDKKLRTDVSKGLDGMKQRIDEMKKNKKI